MLSPEVIANIEDDGITHVHRSHVEVLSAFVWFFLTDDTDIYPGWSDTLLFQARAERQIPGDEPFDDLELADGGEVACGLGGAPVRSLQGCPRRFVSEDALGRGNLGSKREDFLFPGYQEPIGRCHHRNDGQGR